jgi:DNA processing protein
VTAPSRLTPLEPGYPSRLRGLPDAPACVAVQGGSLEAPHAIAVVGARSACREALDFTGELASALASAGAVVVSGGAVGVDAAAHEGALRAAGRTWAVAATGQDHCFPAEHAALYERIGRGPGAMLWPFAPGYRHVNGFLARNRVLVALSDAVVVVQAGHRSGALHAASCARKLGKPLWVVPAAPWASDFAGSHKLLDEGARPLMAVEAFLRAMGLAVGPARRDEGAPGGSPAWLEGLSPDALAVLQATSTTPLHRDAIASRAGQTAQATGAALLTLALEDVVVEDPPGFFRRTNAR